MELESLRGETLDGGRFRLDELLGCGGYGAVFRAVQTSMGRVCALKVLHAKFMDTDDVIGRFRAEARATSSLRHPNTVVIYDYGQDEARGLFYIAMEFLEGESLDERLKREVRMGVAQVVRVVEQVAMSLQDAHDRGIVHRDVKPHNIMLVRHGSATADFVKMIDFGIAKLTLSDQLFDGEGGADAAPLTRSGTMIGTPLYMAPEQIREGGKVDGRTDMYALAMCIYRMLLGRTPYQGMETWQVIGRHMSGPPHPLRHYDASLAVSDDFEQVVLRALRRESVERYERIEEMARALRVVAERDGLIDASPSLHAGGGAATQVLSHVAVRVDAERSEPLARAGGAMTPAPSHASWPPLPQLASREEVQETAEVRAVTAPTARRGAREPVREAEGAPSVSGGLVARSPVINAQLPAAVGLLGPLVSGEAGDQDGETMVGELTPQARVLNSVSAADTPGEHTAEVATAAPELEHSEETSRLNASVSEAASAPPTRTSHAAWVIVALLALLGVGAAIVVAVSSSGSASSDTLAVKVAAEATAQGDVPQKVVIHNTSPSAEPAALGEAIMTGRGVLGVVQRAAYAAAAGEARGGERVEAARSVSARMMAEQQAQAQRAEAGRVREEKKAAPVGVAREEVDFFIKPYGALYIDGKRAAGDDGRGGRVTVKVGVGRHEAHVVKDKKRSSSKRFEVKAGERSRVTFDVMGL